MSVHVLEHFEETVAQSPDAIAIVDEQGSLTFGQLRVEALALAHTLLSKKVQTKRPVAVFLPKRKEAIVAFLAILYSRNIYAPLDVKSPQKRLQAILDKLEAPLILTDETHAAKLAEAQIPEAQLVLLSETQALSATQEAEISALHKGMIDTDPIYIIHTSGSTGTPKGVVIHHRGVLDYIAWARDCYAVDAQAIIGNQAPLYFDNSTLDIYLSLFTGARLVLIPERLFMFPARLLAYLREQEINFIFWVPSALVHVANVDVLGQSELPPLQKILFAGEVMPNKQLNVWRAHFPDALFSNLYGPTEITVDCTYYIVDRPFEDHEPLPIGFARRNNDILILTEDDQPAAPGEQGELCVRGSALALGYWNDPEKTAAAFTQNPLNPHVPERIYRTGDLVTRDEKGEIYFLGRKDSQIKHMGHRIELGEIEHAVRSLPQLRNACVLYEAQSQKIHLFFEADVDLSPGTLRKQLLQHLPNYMLPRAFHQMDKLPMNANDKLDRPRLMREFFEDA